MTTIDVKKLIMFAEKEPRKVSGTVVNPGVHNSEQTIGSMTGGDTCIQTL